MNIYKIKARLYFLNQRIKVRNNIFWGFKKNKHFKKF